jgi:hypothetical protein
MYEKMSNLGDDFKVLKDLNDFKEIFAFHSLIRIFGFALDTPARECSNKFDIPLAYSYLYTTKTQNTKIK